MGEINELQVRLREFARARDWEQFHTPKNLVMALTGEVGELTELFQWLTPEQSALVASPFRMDERISSHRSASRYASMSEAPGRLGGSSK